MFSVLSFRDLGCRSSEVSLMSFFNSSNFLINPSNARTKFLSILTINFTINIKNPLFGNSYTGFPEVS